MVAWYKHDIPAWMDDTEGLPDGAYRVLHVVSQLIYLNEGPIRLNEQGIAGRCRQHILAFRKNLNILTTAGLLTLNPDQTLDEPRANLELGRIGRNRVNAGLGGKGRHKPLKNNDTSLATLQDSSSHKTREDKSRIEKKDAAGAAVVNLFPEPENQTDRPKVNPDEAPDAALYREGRKLLGNNAGGMVAKLLKSQNGNIALARAALLQASTKDSPREYVGRVINRPAEDRDEMGAAMAPGYGDDWG